MNIVDSSGWLEYFAGGPNAAKFSSTIEDMENLLVPTISIYEVFKIILKQKGEDTALRLVAHMHQGKLIELNSTLALLAAKLSIQYSIPMADSLMLATARYYEATLWTQDVDFKGLPGVKYFPKKK